MEIKEAHGSLKPREDTAIFKILRIIKKSQDSSKTITNQIHEKKSATFTYIFVCIYTSNSVPKTSLIIILFMK
jgi:hypothetical protein